MKCSKSKTIRHRKLKSSHYVDLIKSTWGKIFNFLGLIVLDLEHFKVLGDIVFVYSPFIFQLCTFVAKIYLRTSCCKIWIYVLFVTKFEFTHILLQNLILPTFCRPDSFARKSLLSGKFSPFLHLANWLYNK